MYIWFHSIQKKNKKKKQNSLTLSIKDVFHNVIGNIFYVTQRFTLHQVAEVSDSYLVNSNFNMVVKR